MKPNYKELLNRITTFVFDVDGVLTDGTIIVFPGQEPVRAFNIKDGFAIQKAVKKGYRIAIITGGRSQAVKERLNGLGVTDVYLNASNKIEQLQEYMHLYDLKKDEMLYMGDDLPDLPVLMACGVATCPIDSAPEVKATADYVSPIKGGQGCVRDIIEQTMRVQGKWNEEAGDQAW